MPNWEEASATLRNYREKNERNSREVVDLWDSCVADCVHKLSAEKWLVLEQVVVASLDTGRVDLTRKCLSELKAKFPKSNRVALLRGMVLESEKNFAEAGAIYESIIQADDTNAVARKRKVALLRTQGKVTEAIKDLVDYTKIFMADQEAWMELSEMYVLVMDYGKAAFCMEELILSNPHNHLYYQRYADIRYTQGGVENLELAKSYYSQAVKLNPSSARALYGLILSSSQLILSPKTPAPKKAEYVKLAAWAKDKVRLLYNQENADDESCMADDALTVCLGITFPKEETVLPPSPSK